MKITLDLEVIGKRISTERRKNAYTIDKFAEVCGVSEQTIKEIEKGSRDFRVQTLASIAVALGTSTDYLLGLSNRNEKANLDVVK